MSNESERLICLTQAVLVPAAVMAWIVLYRRQRERAQSLCDRWTTDHAVIFFDMRNRWKYRRRIWWGKIAERVSDGDLEVIFQQQDALFVKMIAAGLLWFALSASSMRLILYVVDNR